jgi:hypothetical protein
MKKTFVLSHPKMTYQRIIETAKNDVKKHIKAERNKTLPENADFWGFECKFGQNAATAKSIHEGDINSSISSAQSQHWKSFYLEVVATPKTRAKRTEADTAEGQQGA